MDLRARDRGNRCGDDQPNAPSTIALELCDQTNINSRERTGLEHIEHARANTPKSGNTRLTGLRAFFRFIAYSEPACSVECQRVLAIPTKRHQRQPVEFLNEEETAALGAAPDLAAWLGRRDRALLLASQTDLRSAKIRLLRYRDLDLGVGALVRCSGKGRKTRCTPLRRDVAAWLKLWLVERSASPDDPVFPSARGGFMIADALRGLVSRHVAIARATCNLDRGPFDHAAYASPHDRNGPPAARCRQDCDRSLARPRVYRDDPDLSPCRHGSEGASPRTRHPTRRHPGAVSASGHSPRVP